MTDYDDLVRRLRDYGGAWLAPVGRTHPVCDEAADAIESLREQVADLKAEHRDYGVARDAHDEQVKRAEAAERERDALRQDAERYRWLRSCMWWRTDSFTQDGENIRTGYWQTKLFRNQLYGNLDAAIDAALLAGKKKP